MALKLPDHSHCLHCGNPVPFGEEYCDEVCRGDFVKDAKKTRVKDFLFYATIAVALVVILYTNIL